MSIFGSSAGSAGVADQPATSLRVQTSVAGKPIPLVWGVNRLAPNLLWAGDFRSQNGKGGKSGGKGGGGGGKGSSGAGSTQYFVSLILGLCEGPIQVVSSTWVNTTKHPRDPDPVGAIGMVQFDGDYTQTAWSGNSDHPDQQLSYRGVAYLAGAGISLGQSPALPNYNVEVGGLVTGGGIPGYDQQGGDPSSIILDFLTNAFYGIGFPSQYIGSWTNYQTYCYAFGLPMSPVLTDQQEGRTLLNQIMEATNSEFVWSSGKLNIVPYGDTQTTNSLNGYTYTPNLQPIYSFTDGDFKAPQGGNPNSVASGTSQDPVQMVRKRPSDKMNSIPVEYLDRVNKDYAPDVVYAESDADINVYGLRRDNLRQIHFFTDRGVAITVAQLLLGRQQVLNTYTFTVGQEFILLDPMDLVSITDSALGLTNYLVRIQEIQENTDNTLTITTEDMLVGTGAKPQVVASQSVVPFTNDYNTPAGPILPPTFWEPPSELIGANYCVAIAVSGVTSPPIGGYQVWVSQSGDSYLHIGDTVAQSFLGYVTASSSLPANTPPALGPNIDNAHTLSVDCTLTGTTFSSVANTDMLSANSLLFIGSQTSGVGEYLAYQNAVLASAGIYQLTVLNRSLYGTPSELHVAGDPVIKVAPDNLFTYPFTADRIGQTVYFKFVPYNIYGGGTVDVSQVSPYAYTIQGVAFAESLSNVTNFNVLYIGSHAYFTWTQIDAPVEVHYEIRNGTSWISGTTVWRGASPPVPVPGDGQYWIAAFAEATNGFTTYSAVPVSISVSGSSILSNVAASWDEAATGWTGTLTNCSVSGGDVVSTSSTGMYEIPVGHNISLVAPAVCNINISWAAGASAVGANILTVTDWLNSQDILGSALISATNIHPEIAISPTGGAFGSWIDWQPGSYSGQKFKARMQVNSLSTQVQAILTGFVFEVDVPTRVDHYMNQSIAAIGTAIGFKPDGSGSSQAFNGGPNGAALPHIDITILNAQSGDTATIQTASLSTSAVAIQILNGGVGVVRTCNVIATGW